MGYDSFRESLLRSISRGDSLENQVGMLRHFKLLGGSQDYAATVLSSIRSVLLDDVLENRVLDLMDFVSGFCSPHMRIW